MNKILFEVNDKLKEAVDLLCNAVKVTLGPKGKNVLTIDSYGNAHLTKDGITVAKNVKSDDPIINGVINVVREASSNTAKSAGDGTTTSLVLTQTLFHEGLETLKEFNPTIIKEGMNLALQDVLDYIEENSEKINVDSEKLTQVAYISANNDKEVGDIAVEAVRSAKQNGIINIEDSPTYETFIKVTNGFSFNRGYVSPHFSKDGSKITYEEPLIFISEVELSKETTIAVLTHANKENKPLIIIAPDFNETIFTLLYRNFITGAVQVCPIKSPGFAGNRKDILEDLSDYCNCFVYKNNGVDPKGFCGNCDKIIIDQSNTSIINNTPTDKCVDKINKLDFMILEDENSPMVETFKKRIANLNGSIVTLFVGATTELELKEKKDRIEDAVCAVQTALKDGISEGGGMTFFRANKALQSKCCCQGYDVVLKSLLAPFIQLCNNSDFKPENIVELLRLEENEGFNFKTDTIENLKECGIIDPTLVLKNAITNSVGIVSNLLTTNCITYVG